MNIGILSMQKILNYGSFLQAFSLKKQLESRGHDVYFVDILPGRQIVKQNVNQSDRYALKRIEHYFFSKIMARNHIADYKTYLETDKKLPAGEKFDLVIIGSDEVFNATTPSPWGFTKQLFGCVENAKRVVTYAASCGHTDYQAAENCGIVEEIRHSMKNLQAVSVRDQNTWEFVRSITGKEPELHLDPVFISDYDAYIPEFKMRKPYLLVYAYANRISSEQEIQAIKQYAKENGLKTVSVGMQQRWCDENITASAFELLAFVKNAACIVTDTFHGTVFSIKYNKRFAVLVRDSNRNKLAGLLKQFSLDSRIIENPEELRTIMEKPLDFVTTNAYIAAQRQRSEAYLEQVTAEGK